MLNRLALAILLCTAAATPAVAADPAFHASTFDVKYRLLQVSVPATTMSLTAFAARTQTINSCRGAKRVARDLGARLTRGSAFPLDPVLRQIMPVLAETKTGRATPVLVGNDGSMHVVVVCGRN
jgi:hypothetical protein